MKLRTQPDLDGGFFTVEDKPAKPAIDITARCDRCQRLYVYVNPSYHPPMCLDPKCGGTILELPEAIKGTG